VSNSDWVYIEYVRSDAMHFGYDDDMQGRFREDVVG
jgi:hypothetical protein